MQSHFQTGFFLEFTYCRGQLCLSNLDPAFREAMMLFDRVGVGFLGYNDAFRLMVSVLSATLAKYDDACDSTVSWVPIVRSHGLCLSSLWDHRALPNICTLTETQKK